MPKGEEFKFLSYVDGGKTHVVSGGASRMDSFKAGLASMNFSDDDIILDHNAANPHVTSREISELIAGAKEYGAAAVSQPCTDTVLIAEGEHYAGLLDRENLRLMQTPQAARYEFLGNLSEATDLTSALLKKTNVKIVEANPRNKKITFAEDLENVRAHTFLGEDSHVFAQEGELVLGGLRLAEFNKLDANSDGDVVLHAIGRALAQACGENFSELADPLMLSGTVDSCDYVQPFLQQLRVLHVSLSLECARPKIDPIAQNLKASLGRILQIDSAQISISAHTGEGLTPFGRGEGIRCMALVQTLPR